MLCRELLERVIKFLNQEETIVLLLTIPNGLARNLMIMSLLTITD